jgi:hypothetical protein
MTRVLPKRQKIMGIKDKAGKAPTDDTLISSLALKPGLKVMMLGQPEEVLEKRKREEEADADGAGVADDFQMDEGLFEELEPSKDPDVLVQIRRSCVLLHDSTSSGAHVGSSCTLRVSCRTTRVPPAVHSAGQARTSHQDDRSHDSE